MNEQPDNWLTIKSDKPLTFTVDVWEGYQSIIIARKPSEIPHGIDLELIRLATWNYMDGPAEICIYPFKPGREERFNEALKFLVDCGWKRLE